MTEKYPTVQEMFPDVDLSPGPPLKIGRIPAEEVCEMCRSIPGSLFDLARQLDELGVTIPYFDLVESPQTLASARMMAEEDEKVFKKALGEMTSRPDGVEVSEEDDA